jgi:hypothetical protein
MLVLTDLWPGGSTTVYSWGGYFNTISFNDFPAWRNFAIQQRTASPSALCKILGTLFVILCIKIIDTRPFPAFCDYIERSGNRMFWKQAGWEDYTIWYQYTLWFGLVWFGLFVHPLSHTRNIRLSSTVYELHVTTQLIIYGHPPTII